MRDPAVLELVKLLLSAENSSKERLADLLLHLDVDKSKSLSVLIEKHRNNLSILIETLRFRGNVSDAQCVEAVKIVSPELIEKAGSELQAIEPVFEHFETQVNTSETRFLDTGTSQPGTKSSRVDQYTSQLEAENLRAELEKEVNAPSDLKKEYYYLPQGQKRSFVMGKMLFNELSRICLTGGQSKRTFLDALGRKVERLGLSRGDKLKSKTMRREVLNFIIAIEGASAVRRQKTSQVFRKAQNGAIING